MTTITIKRNEKRQIVRFTVEGHTGSAPRGEDIVCAGLSSVTWAVMNGLEEILSIPIQYEMTDGYADCILPDLSPSEREKVDVLLLSMEAYFDEMIRQYGEFISKLEV